MRTFSSPLPIDAALPGLTAALAAHDAAVLVAPPGAGKTTRVPLVLIDEPWAKDKKILVLEPRRLAARAAATRMAATLGEQVGDTVGLRVRFGSKVSKRTRIEVVTEGIFTRLILDDPSLDGIAAVLFDEFHERSLDADLGLALARDAQQGLREDLKLLVMSATIDGARVASLLDGAPVVESEGRSFPVDMRYLGRDPRTRIENQVADAVERALRAETGSALVFLPGAGEIRRTETLLKERVRDPAVDIVALYGALDMREQDRAISPSPPGRRKVVLATSIAETSLTIEGVRVVIDSGLSRVPRYEPDVGITRLETVRVSRAAADQRTGRAGRVEPGVSYRLWDEPQTGSLEAYTRPEILSADLSSFVLDLAQWGTSDPSTLRFLDPPPAAALSEARALLIEIGAIDAQGRITEEGRKLRALPLPPRLARMVVDAAAEGAGDTAAAIAALVTERGLGGDDVNLEHRLDQVRRDRSRRAEDARAMVRRWADLAGGRGAGELTAGAILALAYPDRIAKNRGGGQGAFLLANGRGGNVDPASALAREPFLAVAELTGAAAASRIVLAAPVTLAEIEMRFAAQIEDRDAVTFDTASASLRARRTRRLGSIVLAEQIKQVSPDAGTAHTLADGIVRLGLDKLPWSRAAQQFRTRVEFLRKAEGDEWPDLTEEGLEKTAADWLEPMLLDKTSRTAIGADELSDAVMTLLPWTLRRRLDDEAPTHFTAPTGTAVPIDYSAEQGPTVSIRVQELFGLAKHPSIAGGRVPLVVELLSPGHKPVQITRDLPGFWRGSYADVRVEMRGRYPRHPWPDDPTTAPPTRRAKPRGT
ncbi:MAG TPA: ATP-dependent helicase HrpB [Pseudolabrys sp.]|uniref:ATP-dependent helicase HrpB n=1 Tax=Pseudolabrys sp. TaxID=1960880 RepID=UPI002DDD2F0F|nr:ATP-dependent helicase HrpB [Pseudolabrys sp.]HEV2627107.1 ATP-dependent helicase HrpB [Pseudolabrys sp.]